MLLAANVSVPTLIVRGHARIELRVRGKIVRIVRAGVLCVGEPLKRRVRRLIVEDDTGALQRHVGQLLPRDRDRVRVVEIAASSKVAFDTVTF